jgi:Phytanoyl-CoA dioxygenase (PhyH)
MSDDELVEISAVYDDFLSEDSVFAWHQDQAYWIGTDDHRTATCWLPVDDSTIKNGCIQFLPGSHREPVRPHVPVGEDRGKVHAIATSLRDGDVVVAVPIRRNASNSGRFSYQPGRFETLWPAKWRSWEDCGQWLEG